MKTHDPAESDSLDEFMMRQKSVRVHVRFFPSVSHQAQRRMPNFEVGPAVCVNY